MCVLFIHPGWTSTGLFLSQTSQFFDQKYFALFDNVQLQKTLITRGYFTYLKNPPWLPEGERVPLSPTTQFSTSRSPPKFPPKNTKKSFENYFDPPSKNPLSSTNSRPSKSPIPSNHPKILPKNHKTPSKINPFSNKNQ